MPITAADAITPALEHTWQQLFKPFRIGQWTTLAFVGLLAGELGFNGLKGSNFQFPGHGATQPHLPASLQADFALLAALIAAGVVAGLAIGIILMYVSSVMRFVLFDGIVARECHIRWVWSRRLGAGWRYFVWKLVYAVFAAVGIGVLVGMPAAYAFAKGWFIAPKEHLLPLISIGVILFALMLMVGVISAVILVLTKDFVIPQMALENVGVMEGWRRLWPMMEAEKDAYASYILMKIVLAIVAGILIAIGTLIVGLLFVVPTAALSVLAILTGKAAGLTWNLHTIAFAVVIAAILLAIFLYLISLISVPAIVFFPAYSMYFFAGRYPLLATALTSASPAMQRPGHVPAGAAPNPPQGARNPAPSQ